MKRKAKRLSLQQGCLAFVAVFMTVCIALVVYMMVVVFSSPARDTEASRALHDTPLVEPVDGPPVIDYFGRGRNTEQDEDSDV